MKRLASRVVFIHSSNEMYGADRILLEVLDTLPLEPSLDVEVWIPSDVHPGDESVEQELQRRGIRTRVLPLPILRRSEASPGGVVSLAIRMALLWFELLKSRPTVVYCATSAALPAAPVARLSGAKAVVLHNQEIWSGSDARVLGVLASFCTEGVAISEAARASVTGSLTTRMRTIDNAVPDNHGAVVPLRTHGPLEFVIASRWNSWKGHATLLAAWDSLASAPGHLTILGAAPESGLQADVVSLVANLRSPESVSIIGQTASVTAFIDRSDVVLVPSDAPEPFGLVAIEAFSRGRPVIATRGGGLAEIVTDHHDGLHFEHRDSAALATIFASLTRADVERMGANARQTYLLRYSQARFLEQFHRLWSNLLPMTLDHKRPLPHPNAGHEGARREDKETYP